MNEKFVNELNRKITKLENEIETVENELKKSMANTSTILNFGLAKYAEKLTTIYAKLEELYDIKETYEYYHE